MIRSLALVSSILVLSFTTYADDGNSLKPVMSDDGNLKYIEVKVNQMDIRVDGYGKIISMTQQTTPAATSNATPSQPNPEQNDLNYDANNVTKINDVPIQFYPCQAVTSRMNVASPIQQIQQRMLEVGGLGCVNGNNGQVRQIGDYVFIYYPLPQANTFNPASGNEGKIQRADTYYFTYYPINAFGNKGGKIQAVNHTAN